MSHYLLNTSCIFSPCSTFDGHQPQITTSLLSRGAMCSFFCVCQVRMSISFYVKLEMILLRA